MHDFTLRVYNLLLESLKVKDYEFQTFKQFLTNPKLRTIILRHDVDSLPQNSLYTAILENQFSIKGTYNFRVVPKSYDEQVIKEIAELGHEIGYHYEDVDLVLKSRNNGITEKWNIVNKSMKEKDNYYKGDVNIPTFQHSKIPNEQLIDAAYESFCTNLKMFRKNFDVQTICMHGSPRSKYDNKDIWKKKKPRMVKNNRMNTVC